MRRRFGAEFRVVVEKSKLVGQSLEKSGLGSERRTST